MKYFFYLLIFGLLISSCGYHSDEEFRAMQMQKNHYINYLEKSNNDLLDFYRMMANLHYSELQALQTMKCH